MSKLAILLCGTILISGTAFASDSNSDNEDGGRAPLLAPVAAPELNAQLAELARERAARAARAAEKAPIEEAIAGPAEAALPAAAVLAADLDDQIAEHRRAADAGRRLAMAAVNAALEDDEDADAAPVGAAPADDQEAADAIAAAAAFAAADAADIDPETAALIAQMQAADEAERAAERQAAFEEHRRAFFNQNAPAHAQNAAQLEHAQRQALAGGALADGGVLDQEIRAFLEAEQAAARIDWAAEARAAAALQNGGGGAIGEEVRRQDAAEAPQGDEF